MAERTVQAKNLQTGDHIKFEAVGAYSMSGPKIHGTITEVQASDKGVRLVIELPSAVMAWNFYADDDVTVTDEAPQKPADDFKGASRKIKARELKAGDTVRYDLDGEFRRGTVVYSREVERSGKPMIDIAVKGPNDGLAGHLLAPDEEIEVTTEAPAADDIPAENELI